MPKAWRLLDEKPELVRVEKAGLKIAVVLLPPIDWPISNRNKEEAEAKKAAAQIKEKEFAEFAAKAREGSDLVIGLSAMGMHSEQQLLKTRPRLFDVLLGSGVGEKIRGAQSNSGDGVWVRPYHKGYIAFQVDVLTPPSQLPDAKAWELNKTVTFGSWALYANIPDHPWIQSMLPPAPSQAVDAAHP